MTVDKITQLTAKSLPSKGDWDNLKKKTTIKYTQADVDCLLNEQFEKDCRAICRYCRGDSPKFDPRPEYIINLGWRHFQAKSVESPPANCAAGLIREANG